MVPAPEDGVAGLAALANVSGHELAEAVTDLASPGAWYDGSGQENGDTGAWTFHVPAVTPANGIVSKVQGEWSNAARTAGTGYPDASGRRGYRGRAGGTPASGSASGPVAQVAGCWPISTTSVASCGGRCRYSVVRRLVSMSR